MEIVLLKTGVNIGLQQISHPSLFDFLVCEICTTGEKGVVWVLKLFIAPSRVQDQPQGSIFLSRGNKSHQSVPQCRRTPQSEPARGSFFTNSQYRIPARNESVLSLQSGESGNTCSSLTFSVVGKGQRHGSPPVRCKIIGGSTDFVILYGTHPRMSLKALRSDMAEEHQYTRFCWASDGRCAAATLLNSSHSTRRPSAIFDTSRQ